MWYETLIAIVVAMFASFGFFCAIQGFAEALFSADQIAVAIEVREKRDAQMLDLLLHEARFSFLRKGKAKLVVLVSADLMDGTVGVGEELSGEYAELLDCYGAECYLMDW